MQNTTRWLLLIIVVSIVLVMKRELASETVNYDTKIMYQFEPKWNLLISTPQVKQQVSEAVARRFLKISETPSTGKHLRLSLLACNSIKKILQYRCFPVKFTKFLGTHFYRTAAVVTSEISLMFSKESGTKTDATVSNTYQI